MLAVDKCIVEDVQVEIESIGDRGHSELIAIINQAAKLLIHAKYTHISEVVARSIPIQNPFREQLLEFKLWIISSL